MAAPHGVAGWLYRAALGPDLCVCLVLNRPKEGNARPCAS